MRIKRLRIHNLYSYEHSDITFENHNVIVGPNASGKTNLIRILKLLIEGPRYVGLTRLGIKNIIRFDPDCDSYLILDVEFSDLEAMLLSQFALLRNVKADEKVINAFKNGSIAIHWLRTPDQKELVPRFLMIRFSNGLTLHQEENYRTHVSYLDSLPEEIDFNTIIKEIKYAGRDKALMDFFMMKHGYRHDQLVENIDKSGLENALSKSDNIREFFSINNVIVSVEFINEMRYMRSLDFNVGLYNYIYPREMREDYGFDLWLLIRTIMRNSFILTTEIRPSYDDLAKNIFTLKVRSEYQKHYDDLTDKFKQIFLGVDFDVFEQEIGELGSSRFSEDGKQQGSIPIERYILVSEGAKQYRLENSASGYFEVLYILAEIANRTNAILVLDEPALHLHPTKITLLARVLRRETSNQLVIITHSPKFVEQEILDNKKRNRLIYIRKISDNSQAVSPLIVSNTIKKHEFKGECFFTNCTILVEGPADHAALIAASELLDDFFIKYDIGVINVDGKENFQKWFDLLDAFAIPWIGMADVDFIPKTEYNQNIISLKGTLEDLFRNLGRNKTGKLSSNEAYDFIMNLNDSEKKKMFLGEIGEVICKTVLAINKQPKDILKDHFKFFKI